MTKKNYEAVRSYGAQTIIALNRRGEKEPPDGTDSNYGMVVKKKIAEDVRRYSNPNRNTRSLTEHYNERTTVERCNSRLKENLAVNDVHVRGIDKVTTNVYIDTIVLLASALAVKNAMSVPTVA